MEGTHIGLNDYFTRTQKMNPNLMILTAAVQSGKTTAIQTRIKTENKPISGILTPDIDGKRMLKNLETGVIYPFQIPEAANENAIRIGRFIFSQETFKRGQEILIELCREMDTLIIIDEIGKLELRGEGFEPALTRFVQYHQSSQTPVLLVVRDYLLEVVIETYGLAGVSIVSLLNNPEWKFPSKP